MTKERPLLFNVDIGNAPKQSEINMKLCPVCNQLMKYRWDGWTCDCLNKSRKI